MPSSALANEGRLVAFVAPRVFQAMQAHAAACGPDVIGTVTANHPGLVEIGNRRGGCRLVDVLSGEQMPRIC